MSQNCSVLNDLQSTESGFHGIKGQISQIPGLSPTTSLPEERARGRRAGVLESDSDYVKLAKQGGHKGLLWHEETVSPKATSYTPPDWFSTASEDNGKPSLINSEEKKNHGACQPPFETDNMSVWERGDSSNNGKEKKNNVYDIQMEKLQSPKQHLLISKFRRMELSVASQMSASFSTNHMSEPPRGVFDKKPAPVDMSKLLSFGYVEDDKPDDI